MSSAAMTRGDSSLQDTTQSSGPLPRAKGFDIRQASATDLSQLPKIFNHYISTTVISFRLDHVGVDLFEDVYATTTERRLPFIVATIPLEHTSIDYPELVSETRGQASMVIGYAYALPFRQYYPAYQATVEISLYVDQLHHSSGVGSALMDELLGQLRTTSIPTISSTSAEQDSHLNNSGNTDAGTRIRQVLSVMSFDTTHPTDGGLRLEKFYERWGFKRVGHLKDVGFKFGRWIDVLFLQLSLY